MTKPNFRMDKTAFSVTSFAQAAKEDKRYWHSCTPEERIAAMEQMRCINYDYDPVSDRIQRIIEVVEGP